MNNKEVITYTLKTTSIYSSLVYNDYFSSKITTTTGLISNNRCNFTWFNINLRNILGNYCIFMKNMINLIFHLIPLL